MFKTLDKYLKLFFYIHSTIDLNLMTQQEHDMDI